MELLDPQVDYKLHGKNGVAAHTYLTLYRNKAFTTLLLCDVVEFFEEFVGNDRALDFIDLLIDCLDLSLDGVDLAVDFQAFLINNSLKTVADFLLFFNDFNSALHLCK